MTDQMIPADKVRPILDEWERIKEYADWDDLDTLVKDIRALLPPPPLPTLATLADMTEEECDACRWMQADTEQWGRAVIITPNLSDVRAALLDRRGKVPFVDHADVTPRPDLPRLEWPADKKSEDAPAPALPDGWRLADHEKRGRVIVTNPTPNRNGRVHFVIPADDPEGYGWNVCDPDKLTYLDQEADQ